MSDFYWFFEINVGEVTPALDILFKLRANRNQVFGKFKCDVVDVVFF